jgi:predicted transcriptional regulator of viral defense system
MQYECGNKNKTKNGSIRTNEVVGWLLSHGIIAVTNEELSALLGVSQNQMLQRLAPLVKRSEIVSPCRGFWIPIPFEYRQWGAPEATYYIDRMMRFLEMDYYIGWMSAASILGAKHHAVQVFQVATDRQMRNRVVGRSDFRFFQRSNVGLLPTFLHKTQTGTIKVSTRAATMLSVTNDLSIAAGLDNAANIIIELSETEESFIDEVAVYSSLFPISALRRLGWILDNFTETTQLDTLEKLSKESSVKVTKLATYKAYSDRIDTRWSIDLNERVEPDL